MMAEQFDWIRQGAPARIMAVLNRQGAARFVGGCVRDSLLGLPPGSLGRTDIDVATTLLPDKVQALLNLEGIRNIPTGIAHGTITALIDDVPIEITTLRADVSTDGRRATIAFTDDWSIDARRRDFTINALYLDTDGNIYDEVGGQADLAANKVRFIGNAEDRLREDYLRILRFLRFSSRFAEAFDPAGWQACIDLKAGLETLSKERLWQETSKTFTTPRAPDIYQQAEQNGVLRAMLDAPSSAALFSRVQSAHDGGISAGLGLCALWPEASRSALRAGFKLSNAISESIKFIRKASIAHSAGMALNENLYRHGVDAVKDGLFLNAALHNLTVKRTDLISLDTAVRPVFPVKGKDLIARGVGAGPELGGILARIELAWIAAGLPQETVFVNRLIAAEIAA